MTTNLFFDTKVVAVNKNPLRPNRQLVGKLVKADAIQCILDMDRATLALFVPTIPIKNAICCIRWCLDLGEEEPRANGMTGPGGDVMTFSWMNNESLKNLGYRFVPDCLFELGSGNAGFQSLIDYSIGLGIQDIPALRFHVPFSTPKTSGFVRMNLNAQNILRIEKFD